MTRRQFVHLVAAAAIAAGGLIAPSAPALAAGEGVVIQVSDGDPKTWNQALNVIRNIQAERKGVKVELVVFGNGIDMLKFDSPVSGRIDEALSAGTDVLMCENTMRGRKVTEKDMHPKIGYVTAGVIEIIDRQKQGWAVVRP